MNSKAGWRLIVVVAALVLSSCADGSSGEPPLETCETRESLTVLAASSLSRVFVASEQSFLAAHPCVTDVQFSFGSSAVLAAQIVNGAPVDVFASASTKTMSQVIDGGVTGEEPVEFARNSAALVVARDSTVAATITGLPDLLDGRTPGVKVGLCAPSVPCGALADEVLANAARAYGESQLTRTVIADTEATNAEDLVTKVRLGELDAGLAYASDCALGAGVRCVQIPVEVSGRPVNSSTALSAVAVSAAVGARDFVRFLVSGEMRTRLVRDFGFGAP